MATPLQRQHGVGLLELYFKHQSQMGYPANDVRTGLDLATYKLTEQELETFLAAGHTVMADCSELTSETWRWMGLKLPYVGPAYTGTMLETMPVYEDAKKASAMAGVVFGPGAGEHVAMVWEPDPKHGNPTLGSHGQWGFRQISLKDEAAFHSPPVRFLNISRY